MVISPPVNFQEIFSSLKTIAVVGLSPKKQRPSHQVAGYMLSKGYTIIPVNPGQDTILARHCYPDLASVPIPVDMVNIFRQSQHVMPVVEQAIAKGVRIVWMQEGIINHEAAACAERAGITVIMDRCLMVDHMNFYTRAIQP
jgi:predicted CoA-binding protein